MKAYTDLNQSKKLSQILPAESADMYYVYDQWVHDICGICFKDDDGDEELEDNDIPCWSLLALLDSIPKVELVKLDDGFWRCTYDSTEHCLSKEPVDACTEMILKLNGHMIREVSPDFQ